VHRENSEPTPDLPELPVGLVALDGAGEVRALNAEAHALTGWRLGEPVPAPLVERLVEATRPRTPGERDGAAPPGPTVAWAIDRGGGEKTRLLIRARPSRAPAGGLLVALSEAEPGGALRAALDELELLRAAYEAGSDAVLIADAAGRITSVNPAFTRITGYDADEVVGRNPRMLASGRHDRAFYTRMWRRLAEEGTWAGEIWNRRRSGEIYPEWLRITAIGDGDGPTRRFVAVFSDLSAKKRSEAELERIFHHDALTGLPNRLLLRARLEHALQRRRRAGTSVALVLLDLGRFHSINDAYGHAIGDEVLRRTARRLQACLRESDTVARVGGDEFAVVVDGLAATDDVMLIVDKLLDAAATPDRIGEHAVDLDAGAGVALTSGDDDTPELLLQHAATALHHAQALGRRAHVHASAMTAAAVERMALRTALREAIDRDELRAHYQPKLDLSSGRVTGAEALVRWQHPVDGLISPARFVPVAEETGLILPLGEWMLRRVCADLVHLDAAGVRLPRVAINASARELADEGFAGRVGAILAEHGVDPARVEIEITESAALRDPERASATLGAIAELGLTLAIDDFGTGYSSFAYLKRLRTHRLKIDRSFVIGVPGDRSSAEICRAVIVLARSLSLTTTAEGVETAEQARFLREVGCDEAQGYLFARPLPLDQLILFLSAQTPARAS
jgi:diguanylate cyclase (GGDEF)-like protein/PAS domain S-box-containing protein